MAKKQIVITFRDDGDDEWFNTGFWSTRLIGLMREAARTHPDLAHDISHMQFQETWEPLQKTEHEKRMAFLNTLPVTVTQIDRDGSITVKCNVWTLADSVFSTIVRHLKPSLGSQVAPKTYRFCW
jgi:hypothetical protein